MSASATIAETSITGFQRRFAGIPVPGVTDPRIVAGITIPAVPENVNTSTNLGQTQSTTADKTTRRQKLAIARRREKLLTISEIESVEFSLFSTSEIDTYAVVNVTSEKEYGENSVRDPKLGPHNDSQTCETCSGDLRGCPGHFGKIQIPRLMHPMAVETIILVLSCVCNSCGGLLVTADEIEREGINRTTGKTRLRRIKELAQKLQRKCAGHKKHQAAAACQPNPVYLSAKENKETYQLAYTFQGKDKKDKKSLFYRTPKDIYESLSAIEESDAFLLGFTEGSHPRDMIVERMTVIPYCDRPDLFQGNNHLPDDLTTMYIDIVKTVNYYNKLVRENAEAGIEEALKNLYFKISHFMQNDGKYSQGKVKVYTDIKKRIQGKSAMVRANIMGKRVNFAGRTVVGPGAYLRVDEVGIPRLMAVRLTRPLPVTEYNRTELQSKFDMERVRYITMQSGSHAGNRIMVNDGFRQGYPDYRLQLGDVIERMMEDGDIVLINRQPTLHKQNILALKARIIDDRIVRINLSITTPLNADFDGDEVNIHVPQTIEAYAEAEQLLSVYQNFMSAQANKPMIGIVYDALSAAYLLTYPEHEFERLTDQINQFNQQINELVNTNQEEYEKLLSSLDQAIVRRAVLQERIVLDPIVYEQAIDEVIDTPQYETLAERLAKYGVRSGTGRALFSSTLPEDFDYNTGGVLIEDGILVRGLITKDHIGNKDGSIIAEMMKQLGGLVVADFISELQFVLREFLQQHGLSVGLDDCIPDVPGFREMIEEEITTATMKVLALTGKSSNRIMAEQQERKIVDILVNAKTRSEKIVQQTLQPDNAILVMANSGAKGSGYNSVQMAAILGLQQVGGKRIPANLPGERSLAAFEPGDPNPKSRGFCVNSFGTGLEPTEFFFHAQGGREGLTDTAVNTAQTGHLQHLIIKSCEDIHISQEGAVRSADNSIMEFVYGNDGMEASELSSVQVGTGERIPFFRNLFQLADKINRKYAPNV